MRLVVDIEIDQGAVVGQKFSHRGEQRHWGGKQAINSGSDRGNCCGRVASDENGVAVSSLTHIQRDRPNAQERWAWRG